MGQTFFGKLNKQKFSICCTTDNLETLELRDSCRRSRRPSKIVPIPSEQQIPSYVTCDQQHDFNVINMNNLLSPLHTTSIGESPHNHTPSVFASNETWAEDIGESESAQSKLTSMRKLITEYDDEIQNCREYLSNSPQH